MKSQPISTTSTPQDARAKHSPLPWKLGEEDHADKEYSYYHLDGPERFTIAMVTGAKDEDEAPNLIEAKANTDFICLAVNNHESLLKAARIAVKDIQNGSLGNAVSVLSFAISKVDGK